jgi:hypothetical protein
VPFGGCAKQAVEATTGGVRTRVFSAPEELEHASSEKVSLKCKAETYRYRAQGTSDYGWQRSTPLSVRKSDEEAGEKTGHGAEGSDGSVGCGGYFPGNSFADNGK